MLIRNIIRAIIDELKTITIGKTFDLFGNLLLPPKTNFV